MDLHKLEYIVEIAKDGNITRAAERLHVSQPTLSVFLRSLEKELGLSLFQRQGNRLVITPEGELYADTCRKILRLRDKCYQDLYRNRSSRLRVGLPGTNAALFSSLILEFSREHPDFHITPVVGSPDAITQDVYNGVLDIGYVVSYEKDPSHLFPGLVKEEIRTYELMLYLAASHPLAARFPEPGTVLAGSDLALLETENMILSTVPSIQNRMITDILPSTGIRPHSMVLQESSMEFLSAHLELSHEFIIAPLFHMPEQIHHYRLPGSPFIRKFLIRQPDHTPTSDEKAFTRLVKKNLQATPYYL